MSGFTDRLDTLASRVINKYSWSTVRKSQAIATDVPIVTFTFDDVPDTALTNGAAILERYGALGTFYLSGSLMGTKETYRNIIDAQGARELARRGHEIGCHTYAHRKAWKLSPGGLRRDIEKNGAMLAREQIVDRAENFAFPYNAMSPLARAMLRRRFRSCRAANEGINRNAMDPIALQAVEIRQPEDHARSLTRWIDDVAQTPGWLIFFTHDIADFPTPYGCKPETLERLVSHAVAKGCQILPVCAALDRLEGKAEAA